MLEYCSQALSCMVRMRHNRPHWLLHEAHSTMSSGSNADARACTPAASRARSMVRASVRARLIRNEKAGAARLLCAQSSTAPRWPNRVSQRATSHRGWLVASAIALTCWRRTLRGSGGVQIRGVATGGPRTRAGQHHADPSRCWWRGHCGGAVQLCARMRAVQRCVQLRRCAALFEVAAHLGGMSVPHCTSGGICGSTCASVPSRRMLRSALRTAFTSPLAALCPQVRQSSTCVFAAWAAMPQWIISNAPTLRICGAPRRWSFVVRTVDA
jgi:hypothetical protein